MVVRLVCFVALSVLGACASGRAITGPEQLRTRFTAPTEVKVGDSAQLVLTVYNESSVDIELPLLADRGAAFDPLVKLGGETVWERLNNSVLMSGSPIMRVPPNGSLTFTAIWHLKDNAGNPIRPGVYDVIARLKDDTGRSIFGDSVRQTIRVNPR